MVTALALGAVAIIQEKGRNGNGQGFYVKHASRFPLQALAGRVYTVRQRRTGLRTRSQAVPSVLPPRLVRGWEDRDEWWPPWPSPGTAPSPCLTRAAARPRPAWLSCLGDRGKLTTCCLGVVVIFALAVTRVMMPVTHDVVLIQHDNRTYQ